MAIFMTSDQEDNAFCIPPPPSSKRQRLVYRKCIICQADIAESLRKARVSSIDTFRRALFLRKDEVYDRVYEELDDIIHSDVFWHSTCYSSYTSEENLRYATHVDEDVVDTFNTDWLKGESDVLSKAMNMDDV